MISIRKKAGFTLIELLTVVAIIGLLTAFILPCMGSSQKWSQKAQTKVRFQQYLLALENYKLEYGRYPLFLENSKGKVIALNNHIKEFVISLSGKSYVGNGSSGSEDMKKYNPQKISFYEFHENEFARDERDKLSDGFGNKEIFLIKDEDGDGIIGDDSLAKEGGWKGKLAIFTESQDPHIETIECTL